jgi:transcriptional regulator with XRE-family HTH domain
MSFSQRVKKAMDEQNITQADLSSMTGIGRSGISQYLSGKNKPGQKALTIIANALNVSEEWLIESDEAATSKIINVPIDRAAKLMGVGKQFIRVGLQNGIFPFGYAVKISGKRFSYYISPKKFSEYTGIPVK